MKIAAALLCVLVLAGCARDMFTERQSGGADWAAISRAVHDAEKAPRK